MPAPHPHPSPRRVGRDNRPGRFNAPLAYPENRGHAHIKPGAAFRPAAVTDSGSWPASTLTRIPRPGGGSGSAAGGVGEHLATTGMRRSNTTWSGTRSWRRWQAETSMAVLAALVALRPQNRADEPGHDLLRPGTRSCSPVSRPPCGSHPGRARGLPTREPGPGGCAFPRPAIMAREARGRMFRVRRGEFLSRARRRLQPQLVQAQPHVPPGWPAPAATPAGHASPAALADAQLAATGADRAGRLTDPGQQQATITSSRKARQWQR